MSEGRRGLVDGADQLGLEDAEHLAEITTALERAARGADH